MPTLTTLTSFYSANGDSPDAGLIADADGNLYGTTQLGEPNAAGSVFQIAKIGAIYDGTLSPLVDFSGANGNFPEAGLITDDAGDLIGTTEYDGTNGDGSAFLIANFGGTFAGLPTALVNFNGANGQAPQAGLIADLGGDLFGTTLGGGANGDGTVFEIAKTGGGYASAPTTLVSFNGGDGRALVGGLVADTAGDLFGMTQQGGANGYGTVFEIAKTAGGFAGTRTTLANFDDGNGAFPEAALMIDAAGDLFGTTEYGGANTAVSPDGLGIGTVFEIARTADGYASAPSTLLSLNGGDGTVFELTGTGFHI